MNGRRNVRQGAHMLHLFRRIGLSRRKPQVRSFTPAVRLRLERLEERDLLAPLAPTGLTATGISASAISLTWNASTDATHTGYDVYAKVWVITSSGKGGSSGHYVYNLLASNLPTNSDTFTGLGTGSIHTYVVTDLNSTGQSLYSYAATGETWIAPQANSPDY